MDDVFWANIQKHMMIIVSYCLRQSFERIFISLKKPIEGGCVLILM